MRTKSQRACKTLLALLIALVMVLGMLPSTVFAYSLKNGVCSECNEWKEGEICDGCYVCVDCMVDSVHTHCSICTECFASDVVMCDKSEEDGWYLCEGCCESEGLHCEECNEHIGDDDSLWCDYEGKGSHCIFCISMDGGEYCSACAFLYCPFCENFEYCHECGFCEDCNAADFGGEAYCTDCGDCLQCKGGHGTFCTNCHSCEDCSVVCESCGEYCSGCADAFCMGCYTCSNCAEICPSCGDECSNCASDGICESCNNCGSCVVICPDCYAACDSCSIVCESCGCCEDCADICENCGEVCSECGNICDDCGFCEDCCADNSDCSDGMCVENSDYDEHFCESCLACFHDVEQCDYCQKNNEFYCVDCCAEAVADAGCDCGGVHLCDLKEHMENTHGETVIVDIGHDEYDAPVPFSRWEYDMTHHWHECRACDQESPFANHITGKAAHTFGADHKCTVCGCHDGSVIVIIKQPTKVKSIPVCPADAWPSDELGMLNNYLTFTVEARAFNPNVVLQYQWYLYYVSDEKEEKTVLLNDNIFSAQDYDGSTVQVPLISGTKTSTLRISPAECEPKNKYWYYCRISDGNGHFVDTEMVNYTTEHVFVMMMHDDNAHDHSEVPFKYWRNDPNGFTTPAPIVATNGNSETTLQGKSTSGYHYLQCLGDGCLELDESSKQPHTMGLTKAYGNYKSKLTGKQIYYKSCTECNYTIYFEEHEHKIEYTSTGKTDFHWKECTRCDLLVLEPHDYRDWVEESGHLCRICVCKSHLFLQETDAEGHTYYPTWDEVDEKNYVLFTVVDGSSDRNFAKWGETITLTAEKRGVECLGPELVCVVNGHGQILSYADDSWGKFTKLTGENDPAVSWSLTFAEERPDNYPEQSEDEIISLIIAFDYEDGCNHKVYDSESGSYTDEVAAVLRGVKEATCKDEGYTGDLVCERCGDVFIKGKTIPKSKYHDYDADAPIDENWNYNTYECKVCGKEFTLMTSAKYNVTIVSGKAYQSDTQISKAMLGDVITIYADSVPVGKVFDKWVVRSGNGVKFAEQDNPVTTFEMPAIAVTIEATYTSKCDGCGATGVESLCPDCAGCCENCGKLCKGCGYCEYCANLCPNCEEYCENCVAFCHDCDSYCSECSNICPDCGFCDNCTEHCPVCGEHCSECAYLCIVCGACDYCSDNCDICHRCDNCCPGCTEYAIIEGKGQTVEKGNSATFKSDADYDDFESVYVDKELVDPSDYSVTEGSTVVTLDADFIEDLRIGYHEILIISANGAAEGYFMVTNATEDPGDQSGGQNPETGSDNAIFLSSALMLIACMGIVATIVLGKKKYNR